MNKNVIRILFILFPIASYSQDTSSIHFLGKSWLRGMIYMSASVGKDKYYRNIYSFQDLREDTYRSSSFYTFNQSEFNQYHTYPISYFTYSAGVSFNPYSKLQQKANERQELRFSLLYYKGIDNYIHFTNKYHPDPYNFTSSDTSFISYISYHQVMDQIGLESTYLIRSENFLKRLNLYTGLGIGLSYTLFSRVEEIVDHFTIESNCITTASGIYCYNSTTDAVSETYCKNNHAFALRTGLPYGLDLKLLSELHLYLEGKAGIAYQKFFHGKGRMRTQNSLGLGIRFKF